MKLRLSHKLSIVMVSTVLVSAVVSAFFISRTTRSAFLEMVRENDIRTASILAENIAASYEREKGWSEIKNILEAMNRGTPLPRQAPGMMRGSGQPGAMDQTGQTLQPGQSRQTSPFGMMPYRYQGSRSEIRPELRILVTDDAGRIVGHNLHMKVPDRLSLAVLEKGVPIMAGSGVVGYLFVQSMLETAIGPLQNVFLQRVYRAIFFSMLIVVVIAPAVGVLLMGHITRPLSVLSEAAAAIARKDYSSRPDIERSDEIGDLARSFSRMAAEIEASEEWKKKLIADSAHELRTPVTLLQGNIEMMMEGIYPTDHEHLKGLYEETLILGRLVRELQELARAESKLTDFNFQITELNELFTSVLNTHRGSAMRKDLELELNIPKKNFPVLGDREKLVQVFSNIIQNAIRYTPTGGRLIAESYQQGESTVICALEDNGPGIPEEEREKVFERFYRLRQDRNRATGGSGLGLAIAREILLRHGGTIEIVRPKYLAGARIEIHLGLSGEGGA
jgi:signal transduction histidine kinase